MKELLTSKSWSEVHVIVRKEPELWSSISDEERNKLKITTVDNFDTL